MQHSNAKLCTYFWIDYQHRFLLNRHSFHSIYISSHRTFLPDIEIYTAMAWGVSFFIFQQILRKFETIFHCILGFVWSNVLRRIIIQKSIQPNFRIPFFLSKYLLLLIRAFEWGKNSVFFVFTMHAVFMMRKKQTINNPYQPFWILYSFHLSLLI